VAVEKLGTRLDVMRPSESSRLTDTRNEVRVVRRRPAGQAVPGPAVGLPALPAGGVAGRTRFGVPRQFFPPGIPDLQRDSESVLSGYLSLSWSAPHLFDDRLDDFAAEVRALLANRSTEGAFWDWPGDTEVVTAHKPG
jgi:hypothetical protein